MTVKGITEQQIEYTKSLQVRGSQMIELSDNMKKFVAEVYPAIVGTKRQKVVLQRINGSVRVG